MCFYNFSGFAVHLSYIDRCAFTTFRFCVTSIIYWQMCVYNFSGFAFRLKAGTGRYTRIQHCIRMHLTNPKPSKTVRTRRHNAYVQLGITGQPYDKRTSLTAEHYRIVRTVRAMSDRRSQPAPPPNQHSQLAPQNAPPTGIPTERLPTDTIHTNTPNAASTLPTGTSTERLPTDTIHMNNPNAVSFPTQ